MIVAIVGAGFSGCQLALELLRQGGPDLEIVLIECDGGFGPGRAYGARSRDLLLNTRAGNLGAYQDETGHFVDWLRQHHPALADKEGFAPRRTFGEYLEATLEDARRAAPGGARLELVRGRVSALDDSGDDVEITLDDGRRVTADQVVICTGMATPQLPDVPGVHCLDPQRCITDPWNEALFERIRPAQSVVILGTGLTMVDAVLLLEARGHTGPIMALSRRGLLPMVHRPAEGQPSAQRASLLDFAGDEPLGMRSLVAAVRREVARAAADGRDWRSVIDALRPSIAGIWQRLPTTERRRFLRHVRPFWEIHRHRMPPESARTLARRWQEGTLEVRAGRITGFEPAAEGVRFTFQKRGTAQQPGPTAPTLMAADWLVNCTGPSGPAETSADPLVRHLLASGQARLDPLGLGYAVTIAQRLIGRDGLPSARLFAHGPIARGASWEMTAVPEIRAQGHRLARLLTRLSGRREHAPAFPRTALGPMLLDSEHAFRAVASG